MFEDQTAVLAFTRKLCCLLFGVYFNHMASACIFYVDDSVIDKTNVDFHHWKSNVLLRPKVALMVNFLANYYSLDCH